MSSCSFSISIVTYLSVALFVASMNTFGAFPAFLASFHLNTHKHQWSPGFRPGNQSPTGVERSFPFDFVYTRNSLVIVAHTVCVPESCASVWHFPSRYQPKEVMQIQWYTIGSSQLSWGQKMGFLKARLSVLTKYFVMLQERYHGEKMIVASPWPLPRSVSN